MRAKLLSLAVIVFLFAGCFGGSEEQLTVTAVNPGAGWETGGTAVTITGTDFVDGATVTFGGSPATSLAFVDAARIDCVTPPGTGTVDVVVTNPDTQSGTLAGGFRYAPPPEPGAISGTVYYFGLTGGNTIQYGLMVSVLNVDETELIATATGMATRPMLQLGVSYFIPDIPEGVYTVRARWLAGDPTPVGDSLLSTVRVYEGETTTGVDIWLLD